jgi:hypothetical protein
MKTKFIFFLLIVVNIGYSQTEILIDFKTKKEPKLEKANKLSEGDFYKIKVDNINPNRYKITLNAEDITVTSPLATPTFKDISLDGLSKLTSSFKISSGLTQQFNNLESSITFNQDFNNLLATFPLINTSATIKEKINTFSDNSKNYNESLSKIKMKYDNVKMEFYKFRIDKFKQDNTNNTYNLDKVFNNFNEIRNSIGDLKLKISAFQNEFETFISTDIIKAHLALAANKDDKENTDKITSFIKEINVKINEFIEAVSAENVDKVLKSIVFLSNDTSFTSLPIQFRKDQAKVILTFTPVEDAKNYLQTESMTFYFPGIMKDYWSIGTSFYYAFNMLNERFSTLGITDENDDTTYIIKQEEDVKQEFGMALLMRYGWKDKCIKSLGYHFSFGPGVAIEKDIKPRLLLGGGFSLGKKHSITLDAGFLAGYVDRKSSIVDFSQTYTIKPENLTVTKLDYSPYLSLGYMYKL